MRYGFAIFFGGLITLALLLLMSLLLSNTGKEISRRPQEGGVVLMELPRDFKTPEAMRQADSGPRTAPQRAQPTPSPPMPAAPTAVDRPPPSVPQPAAPSIPAPGPVIPDRKQFLDLSTAKVEKPEPPKPKPPKPKPPKPKPPKPQPPQVAPADSPAVVPKPVVQSPTTEAPGSGEPGAVAEGASPHPPGLGSAQPGLAGLGGEAQGEAIPLLRLEPVYPRAAARAGKEGWVKVAFTITAEGGVVDASVVESSPRRVFDRSALRAIRKWRFQPRLVDGKPVKSRATQLIEFKLSGD
jgi:protein TonB